LGDEELPCSWLLIETDYVDESLTDEVIMGFLDGNK